MMLSSSRTRSYSLALSFISMPLGSWAGWEWSIQTVYDSPTCSGAVVQNNFVISYEDCVANTTCQQYSDGAYAGYGAVAGCSKMNDASTDAYTAATLGSDVGHVVWITYSDQACKNLIVASDSQMAKSLSEAYCIPGKDGISKKYTYNSSKTITSLRYGNENCEGTPISVKLLASTSFGTCSFRKRRFNGSCVYRWRRIHKSDFGLVEKYAWNVSTVGSVGFSVGIDVIRAASRPLQLRGKR
ncbi:unnamed protein product [Phytophthora fragariaefolia]|uniref:Unnamed protein product n=1 Tax=Phytophthora fragariaefolia TaxID=1490495 RepID=A0A9W6TSH2_9STRA|nr:unnamed protein product [Phytophthora fragariaefolia]